MNAGGSHVSAQRVPKERGRRRNVISTILIICGLALLLVAGGMFLDVQQKYHKQDEVNQELATYVTTPAATDQGPQVDWSGLEAINKDLVGWIQIPGTPVNFPVYQGTTNETYLRTDARGNYSIGGQIFLDSDATPPGLVDSQTLIYGHHLNNGAMFASVDDMADQEKFDKVSTVWYVTQTGSYELQPLFFYRTPATNGDARKMKFLSIESFHNYLRGILAQASARSPDADSAVPKASRVLTLATCDYNNNFGKGNGRGLLVCALKSEVSSAADTTSAVS